ncbi:MAG TPA: TPM domain-containing protein, partial [Reyranella sp.]|nr:TPM domain-containing protein [Reyranella sp.]
MVSLRRLVPALLVLLGLALPALADPPIPPLSGRVVDLAHVLDQRTVDALTQQLADHEAATTNQVVVVTLLGLEGYAIEDWGRALLNGWGIGQRDKNNGVVLVVAPDDRRLRIEVGYGLDQVLTRYAASNIIETEIVPRFKRADMRGGITAGVN